MSNQALPIPTTTTHEDLNHMDVDRNNNFIFMNTKAFHNLIKKSATEYASISCKCRNLNLLINELKDHQTKGSFPNHINSSCKTIAKQETQAVLQNNIKILILTEEITANESKLSDLNLHLISIITALKTNLERIIAIEKDVSNYSLTPSEDDIMTNLFHKEKTEILARFITKMESDRLSKEKKKIALNIKRLKDNEIVQITAKELKNLTIQKHLKSTTLKLKDSKNVQGSSQKGKVKNQSKVKKSKEKGKGKTRN
jgi:DNA replication protein DnaD